LSLRSVHFDGKSIPVKQFVSQELHELEGNTEVAASAAPETVTLDERREIVTIPGHLRIMRIFPVAVILFAVLGCGEAQEARSESEPSVDREPVAVFNITYGDEVTRQESFLVGEEVVDDVDCTIVEYFYTPPASRLSSDGTTPTTLLSGKLWIAKATGEWMKIEEKREIMGDTLTVLVTNTFRFNPPLSVGQSWSFDRDIRLIPELRPPSSNRYRGEVVSRGDIVVPAGTFTCFRVELSLVAVDGVELEDPAVQSVMWITVDTHEEVKRESYSGWEETETAELVSSRLLH
jgi:hypothetical protein